MKPTSLEGVQEAMDEDDNLGQVSPGVKGKKLFYWPLLI